MKNLFIQHKEKLKDLLRFGVLRTEELKNPGLYNGKLGMIILFYEYSRYSGDILYEQFADEMMDSVLELPDSLPFRFTDGLTGIGWGITYLLREKFIEGDIEEILSEVDEKLANLNSHKTAYKEDYDLYSAIRMNYKTSAVARVLIPDPSSDEEKIVRQIWNSCFNLSK
ncbi:hypothetical protein [Bacteroides sp.]|uniref:hypothetical protein n=1 Tax=Bacteroides sp. TaxID=29523 RepID=UPI0026305F1A|nr:hypothetical protein [Bacteroides sp.]MDD3040942.1 hypothetical protein [Bacteroides sp.]